jgi:hypothetical protein
MKSTKELLDDLSIKLWKRHKNFISARIIPKEDTLSDDIALAIRDLNSPNIEIRPINKVREGKLGADFDLWVGGNRTGFRRYSVQAKLLKQGRLDYPTLFYQRNGNYQHELLKRYSRRVKSSPLYLFYNYFRNKKIARSKFCCKQQNFSSFGCTFTSMGAIESMKLNSEKKTFVNVHQNFLGRPLKCMACFNSISVVARAFGVDPLILSADQYNNFYRNFPELEDDVGSGVSFKLDNEEFGKPRYRIILRIDSE